MVRPPVARRRAVPRRVARLPVARLPAEKLPAEKLPAEKQRVVKPLAVRPAAAARGRASIRSSRWSARASTKSFGRPEAIARMSVVQGKRVDISLRLSGRRTLKKKKKNKKY